MLYSILWLNNIQRQLTIGKFSLCMEVMKNIMSEMIGFVYLKVAKKNVTKKGQPSEVIYLTCISYICLATLK